MPCTTFIAWAAKSRTSKIITLEQQVMHKVTGTLTTLCLSNVGGEWNGLCSWRPYLSGSFTMTRGAQSISHGRSLISYGSLGIAIALDSYYDSAGTITGSDLLSGDYSIAGRPSIVRIGGLYEDDSQLPWNCWTTLIHGYAGRPQFGDDFITLPLKSRSEKVVSTTVPPNKYDNNAFPTRQGDTAYAKGYFVSPETDNERYYECTTAGTTGVTIPTYTTTVGNTTNDRSVVWTCRKIPDSTKNRRRPICYGQLENASPVLVDEHSNTYQIMDQEYGPANSLTSIFVDGKVAAATVNTTYCWIRFAADPGGQVTCRMQGYKPGGTYINKPGQIVSDLLTTFTSLTAADLDVASFTTYSSTFCTFAASLYLENENDVGQAIDAVLTGLLTIWYDTRAGDFTIKRIEPASGPPTLYLTDLEITDWREVPEEEEPPIHWKVTIKGDHNWTPMSNPEATLSQDRREWLKEEFRSRSYEFPATQTTYPLATEGGPHETCLNALGACSVVGQWWHALYGTERRLMSVTAKLQLLSVELGDVVQITRNRFGMEEGVLGRVVELTETFGEEYTVEMKVLV